MCQTCAELMHTLNRNSDKKNLSMQGMDRPDHIQIALSKPFVDSVAWHDLLDSEDVELPLGGLRSGQRRHDSEQHGG